MQYGEFAYIYDRLMHEDIDYDRLCDYIENMLLSHDCDPQTICELACGTGSVTKRLTERGYDITGVDISSDMLAAAAEKVRNAELMCIDMTRFVPRKKYDAFLCMIDGINYVTVPEALLRLFKNVRAALSDGGAFMFDISSEHKLRDVIGSNTFIHSEYDVFYAWQNEYYEKYNICDMLLNFFVLGKNGEYSRFEERHTQRGWTEKQIRALLKKAGFSEIYAYDDLSFEPPGKDSERIVFVCK